MATPVRYDVDLGLRDQHLLRVRVTIPEDVTEARLVLPTWTPGSYVVRDYAHHVQSVRARVDGEAAAVRDEELSTWVVDAHRAGATTVVELEVYGHELTVRTNHVDDHHALVVAAATFPAVDAARDRPHHVRFDVPDGQRAWGLLPAGDEPGEFVADDYLHLVDAAFEVGDFPHVTWDVAGVPHRFVWAGHGPAPDLERVGREAAAITTACVELFGGTLPVEEYTFLTVGWDTGGGGLEHRDGSVLQMPVLAYRDPDRHAIFQTLLCHEYLHLWNVKRLTPAELVAPDLQRPTRTSLLWVAEGWTAYYDELLPLRAGLWTRDRWLAKVAEQLQVVCERPGALQQSVAQASRESWIKAYVRDENSPNVGVDYYGHGAMLAFTLDLLLRADDPEGPGLDAALRLLWERHGGDDPGRPGYTTDDVVAAVSEVAGRDLGPFFAAHVDRAVVPPVREHLDVIGLRVVEKAGANAPAWLGATIEEKDHATTLTAVHRSSPAWEAGLSGGDQVVAIDGVRLNRGDLETALRGRADGEAIDVAVFRGPRLLHRTVRLRGPRRKWRLRAVEQPSDVQRSAFHAWSGGHDLPT